MRKILWVAMLLCLALPVTNEMAKADAPKSNSMARWQIDCAIPSGLFGQITPGVSMALKEEAFGIALRNEESTNQSPHERLDEILPIYKFQIVKRSTEVRGDECSRFDLSGKLISPLGKSFEFKTATFTNSSRRLHFQTVERDGMSFEGDAEFLSSPRNVDGVFQVGTLKLKAVASRLGVIKIEFPIQSLRTE